MLSLRVKIVFLSFFLFNFFCSAQFTTVTRSGVLDENGITSELYMSQKQRHKESRRKKSLAVHQENDKTSSSRISPHNPLYLHKVKSLKNHQTTLPTDSALFSLPLTFPNLIKAINCYRIRHPRIVLAQVIQETGWLQSNVCKTKNNLFGLTNPRTGKYYEFSHWSESVRAYSTMVQYKYTSGNYYHWLQKIGYAEDPNYVESLRIIVKRYL